MTTIRPDWSTAPPDAVAWAANGNGKAQFFREVPTPEPAAGIWLSMTAPQEDYNACPDWRDSLELRPEE